MTFSSALPLLRAHTLMRRSIWQNSWVGLPLGAPHVILFWRSGFQEKWRPTLEDVFADDWSRLTEGEPPSVSRYEREPE